MSPEALPAASLSRILGLLEILDDRGGRAQVSRLAQEIRMDSGELLPVLQGAELMELVNTPGGDVVLLPLGKRVIESDMNTKKAIVKEQMEKLPLFRFFIEFLSNHPEKAVEKDEVLEELAILLPTHEPEIVYDTLLNWGRYGEIFGFSRDTGRFFLNTRARKRRVAATPAPTERRATPSDGPPAASAGPATASTGAPPGDGK